MTLQQLKYIVTVAECGNITEAAEKLFIAQPSLTSAIHNIEEEMGITAFIRSNKGVELTRDGETLLSYARQILEQTDVMTEHFKGERNQKPRFSVSCQHYSFAVNEAVLSKLINKNDLNFEELYIAKPHVFISNNHPLADKEEITIQDLMPYPYLVFEQGKHNSFYFSEEFLSSLEFPKNIMVRDRATLFNLLIGLNGFTVCSGIIDTELNGENIISKPLDSDCSMRIGILTRKNSVLSRYGVSYLNVLKNHLSID